MHFISLYGMHAGGGGLYESSGEAYVLEWLITQRKAGQTHFLWMDVGANDGGYSRMIEKLIRQKGLTPIGYLFEPNPNHSNMLSILSKDSCFKYYNCALGSKAGIADFFSMAIHTLSSLVDPSALYGSLQLDSVQKVQVQTLDSIIAIENISDIDLLKIDVEGFELEVLKGAMKHISAKKIGAIQFEFGNAQITSRCFLIDFFEILLPGYTIHRMLKDGITPALSYHRRFEIFQTTNFLALRKPD